MDEQAWARQIGLTRGKAALVALLAVVLVSLIYIKYGPSSADDASALHSELPGRRSASRTASQPAAGSSASEAPTVADAGPSSSKPFDQPGWKVPELATVIAFDPFALPASFPQPAQLVSGTTAAEGTADPADAASAADQLAEAIEQLRMELEQLQQRGVQVIVRGRDQYVAMIGDRTVHVGDEISGFTVTAIEQDHVRVERKVQK